MEPFSAILGLVGSGLTAGASIFGANKQAQTAKEQMRLQEKIAKMQNDMAMLNYGMSRDQMRKQDENNEYMRRIEQQNRMLKGEERDFAVDWLNRNQTQLSAERQYAIDRQVKLDQEAAKQRQFQLEQLLRNQNLAAEERQFAIQQLQEAKAVASGERNEDLKRFYQEKETVQQERAFAEAEYGRNRQQLQSERGLELARRRAIEDQVARLQASLSGVQQNLGAMPDVPFVTRADYDAEEARRAAIYTADVDRAAERAASVNAARLTKGGIDSSTTATQSQADIAKRLASEYAKARMMARDEAYKYITGQQGVDMAVYDKRLGARKYALDETGAVTGAGLDAMMKLPNLPSAVTQDYLRLPSGNYTRNLMSANNYRAPIDIRSGIYNMDVPVGMGQTISPASAANYSFLNLPTAMLGPQQLTISDPAQYAQLAMSGMNQAMTSQNDMTKYFNNAASLASQQAGQATSKFLGDLTGTLGKSLDSWWNSQKPIGYSTTNEMFGPPVPSNWNWNTGSVGGTNYNYGVE